MYYFTFEKKLNGRRTSKPFLSPSAFQEEKYFSKSFEFNEEGPRSPWDGDPWVVKLFFQKVVYAQLEMGPSLSRVAPTSLNIF